MKNQKLLARINNFIANSHENERTHELIKGRFYYTENPINYNDSYDGMKYFLCYHNTHTILAAFKTQGEIEEFLMEYGF